jgi:general secretion pathway protein I
MMPSRQKGFSLLEVLVAFVILALSLGVIMRLFSTNLRNIGASERSSQALLVAESVLAKLGVETPLVEGEQTGEEMRGYRWRARVTRFVEPNAVLINEASPVRLYQVDLAISKADASSEPPALTLTTLRAVPKQ